MSSQVFNYVSLFHFKAIYISFPRSCRLQKLETMAEKFAEYEFKIAVLLHFAKFGRILGGFQNEFDK